jgi:hypothetical protein
VGVIAGAVVGSILLIVIVLSVVFILTKRRRSHERIDELTSQPDLQFVDDTMGGTDETLVTYNDVVTQESGSESVSLLRNGGFTADPRNPLGMGLL